MKRQTGVFRVTNVGGEKVRAFVPHPLPPRSPAIDFRPHLTTLHATAVAEIGRLAVAGMMVPSADWFLYGFVRKEAVISSQIEGTQATLKDVLTFEVTQKSDRLDDVQEVCSYLDALNYARREMGRAKGLPLSTRLLCEAHKRLMRGVRGEDKQPGAIRTSQNWIGGTRPGNASFVPPPPDAVPEALSAFDKWLHSNDPLPPLVKAGLAHVQFETIHPFLDGNGRIGRLLIALLVEHWQLLSSPLLYLSLAFKRRREEYYQRLSAVRLNGDWEGWIAFFLECVCESAADGVSLAGRLFKQVSQDRQRLLAHTGTTIPAVRLFDLLPSRPIVTLPLAMELLKTTKPTASKAIEALRKTTILEEITGKQRDRIYVYQGYLHLLTKDTESINS